MRGRNNNNNNNGNNHGNRKAPNPLQRSYESNGPDVKVRGTAQHVAEKYLQLARDAQSSGDPVAAENYFQHAEHYYRILLAAQEQMAQQFGHSFPPNRGFVETNDDEGDEGDEDAQDFQPGAGPQPEIRSNDGGQANFNGNGYNGNGAHRQEGGQADGQGGNGQRFDRPNRNDRHQHDRNNGDRQGNDRQNNDRNGPRRFDRNDRQDRPRFDRNEGGQGGYAPRPDAPRSDIPVPSDQPDAVMQPRAPEPRFERPDRPERSERPERGPRPERRPRREPDAVDSDGDVAAALPSFLTTPVRVPISVADEAPASAPAAEPDDAGAGDAPKRPRRRRSPREVMDALGSDGDNAVE
ncbi:MAG: DUF4167 domain-containing protein [Beijerinckiaceae bacterium]|nr:DUF4167 domain-containing protein [Beijerinckiaceae bacterium]